MTSGSSAVNGDLLSAASLLLTALSLLYATWYGDIAGAREVAIPLHDTAEVRSTVRTALWGRAVPVLIGSTVFLVALSPPAWSVLRQTWNALWKPGHGTYDPVQACFIGVVAALGFLAVVTAITVRDLARKLRRIPG
jgi:hypothetical protein